MTIADATDGADVTMALRHGAPPHHPDGLAAAVARQLWYHTIELAPGVVTPGRYDLRSLLPLYALPDDLRGKSALDVGTGSGFFAFEFEARGASRVVATELPDWHAIDKGSGEGGRATDWTPGEWRRYLDEPFALARAARGSQVELVRTGVYELTPEKVGGTFDVVLCASVLVHVSDPVRALAALRSVTHGVTIIATSIDPDPSPIPRAHFLGGPGALAWWAPNRACLELLIATAGYRRAEWFSSFELTSVDGVFRSPHAVVVAHP